MNKEQSKLASVLVKNIGWCKCVHKFDCHVQFVSCYVVSEDAP